MDDLTKRVEFARVIASEAGKILLGFQEKGFKEHKKGAVDFVTDADQAAEEFLTKKVMKNFANDAIFAEEGGGHFASDGFSWLIDPLDGTTNFLHGVPHYAVSVGIAFEGVPVGGAVLDPHRDELFWCIRGQGAYLGTEKICVSKRNGLSDALLATGFPYNRRKNASDILARVERALLAAHGIRRCGAAALDLCWLACGRFDGFFEQTLNAWDTCAGVAIVWEAGGTVSDYHGNPFLLKSPGLVACNSLFHDDLLWKVVTLRPGESSGLD